nr:Rep protein [crane CRESS-DNA virus]
MGFNFHAKYGLFTYAQCGNLDPFGVVEHFSSLGSECIIGRETHADGGTHLHVFAAWESKFRTRRTDAFDVEGHHPNVVPSRGTPEKGFDYAVKDGDVVAGGLERPNGSGLHKTRDTWAEIISADSRDEFWRLITELAPRSLGCNFNSLQSYANWRYRVEPEPYRHPESITFDTRKVPDIDRWVRLHLASSTIGGELSYTCASSLRGGIPTGLFSLDESIEGVSYGVFDDMQGGLEYFHSYKFWLGCQNQFYATDKYKGKKLIKWGRPSIYIANIDPRSDKGADVEWLEANCIFVYIGESILA